MKHPNLRHYSTEKISHRVLYALTAVTAVVFSLFYFVDFDHPFYDNPEYNAPKFTGLLIAFIVFFVAASVLTGFVALAVSIRKNGRAGGIVNGIHTARITSTIVAFTALLLIITFVRKYYFVCIFATYISWNSIRNNVANIRQDSNK